MDKKTKLSKQDRVLKYLQTHKRGITQRVAIDKFQAYRLSGIIFRLKGRGYHIITNMEVSKNQDGTTSNYARYVLI